MSDTPNYISLDQIQQTKEFLKKKIVRTPLIPSLNLGRQKKIKLSYKAEFFQTTGSFKLRGVLNKLSKLSQKEKEKGVVTISAGNHAKALSYAAAMMKINATVIMPDFAPKNKIEAARSYGSEVIQTTSENLLSQLNEIIDDRDLTLVHPFDDLDILVGPGTIGLEIIEDNPNVDMVVVPIGGGGLISGISAALKLSNPDITVIGVEPKGANAMTQSLAQNKVVTLEKMNTIADGLAAPWVGEHTLNHVKRFVDGIILVSDEEILRAMRELIQKEKMVVEPAGAAGLAAILSGKINLSSSSNITSVLSGSNVDQELLNSLFTA